MLIGFCKYVAVHLWGKLVHQVCHVTSHHLQVLICYSKGYINASKIMVSRWEAFWSILYNLTFRDVKLKINQSNYYSANIPGEARLSISDISQNISPQFSLTVSACHIQILLI